MSARDPFVQFANVAKLLEDLDPLFDMLVASKAKIIALTGCTDLAAADLAVALMTRAFRQDPMTEDEIRAQLEEDPRG